MASNRSKSAPKRETRQALTFEMALQLCPHEGVAENVATAFGLIVPEYDAIRAEHASALKRMAEAFEGSLNDKATEMHFQRIVGALVGSAAGAGRFYSTKVGEARAATARPPTAATTNTGPDRLEARRSDPRIRRRHGHAGLRPARRRPRRDRRLQGPDRRRLEGLEAPAEAQVEKKAARPDGRLRGLTPPGGDQKVPAPLPSGSRAACSPEKEPSDVRQLHPLEGQRPTLDLLPGHDDREFSLSNANAADVLDALGIEDSSPNAPGRSTASGRSSSSPGASASATLPQPSLSPKRGSRNNARDRSGRPEGYIEQKLAQLSDLVNEGVEIGATYVGWG